MKFTYCSNCGKKTGHKRSLGFGTFFAAVLTGGLWLLAIPLYPTRCIICGQQEDSDSPNGAPTDLSLKEIKKAKERYVEDERKKIMAQSYLCLDCGYMIREEDLEMDAELFCPKCGGRLEDG